MSMSAEASNSIIEVCESTKGTSESAAASGLWPEVAMTTGFSSGTPRVLRENLTHANGCGYGRDGHDDDGVNGRGRQVQKSTKTKSRVEQTLGSVRKNGVKDDRKYAIESE